MRDAILHQRIDQRHSHMVLSRNICETLWPVFSCKNLVCHKQKSTRKSKTNQPNRAGSQSPQAAATP
jgi:hypothetical protein